MGSIAVKLCVRCRDVKPVTDFGPSKKAADRLSCYCRICRTAKYREYRSKYRQRDPEYDDRQRNYARNGYMLRTFGITREEYESMLARQEGLCAICKQPETLTVRTNRLKVRELAVDHNHSTGEVRGLLCGRCNSGIGHFRENIKFLRGAIEYIEFYSAKETA